ncbi:hypothetical protein HNR42_002352 [Deinobacterium chartae]|uniref:Purine nucleoside phosphorylase n=1 Tax=Deinobacterium chartae TaxID=521158 RepID=A0A841HZU0_9DEIO|nr:hypothetical protein [Deinobacterium chartae]
MWLSAPNLTFRHGFSLRHGGVSQGPFASLNFDDRQDHPLHVAENRRIALSALGFDPDRVARLEQVHSCEVLTARPGVQTGDAQVSDVPGLALAIGTADCYPILLEDPEAGIVGAAHAGWRGTVGRIAARTVEAMQRLGARPERIRAAIGPGISRAQYPVGPEVRARFLEAGFPEEVLSAGPGGVHLDLLDANRFVLREAGLGTDQIWAANRCSTEADFFSYRRDAGQTGRMWAVIGA